MKVFPRLKRLFQPFSDVAVPLAVRPIRGHVNSLAARKSVSWAGRRHGLRLGQLRLRDRLFADDLFVEFFDQPAAEWLGILVPAVFRLICPEGDLAQRVVISFGLGVMLSQKGVAGQRLDSAAAVFAIGQKDEVRFADFSRETEYFLLLERVL